MGGLLRIPVVFVLLNANYDPPRVFWRRTEYLEYGAPHVSKTYEHIRINTFISDIMSNLFLNEKGSKFILRDYISVYFSIFDSSSLYYSSVNSEYNEKPIFFKYFFFV